MIVSFHKTVISQTDAFSTKDEMKQSTRKCSVLLKKIGKNESKKNLYKIKYLWLSDDWWLLDTFAFE